MVPSPHLLAPSKEGTTGACSPITAFSASSAANAAPIAPATPPPRMTAPLAKSPGIPTAGIKLATGIAARTPALKPKPPAIASGASLAAPEAKAFKPPLLGSSGSYLP